MGKDDASKCGFGATDRLVIDECVILLQKVVSCRWHFVLSVCGALVAEKEHSENSHVT